MLLMKHKKSEKGFPATAKIQLLKEAWTPSHQSLRRSWQQMDKINQKNESSVS